MNTNYKTARLFLRELTAADNEFIFELVNTPGWIKFIGDRDIKSSEDADKYIQKIIANPNVSYRVVTLQDTETAIGIVTFIKRDYLDHHDIGFAFLPDYNKQGYAYEATKEVLNDLLNAGGYSTILATTFAENISSIQLLVKLGFCFSKVITNDKLTLQLYARHKDS